MVIELSGSPSTAIVVIDVSIKKVFVTNFIQLVSSQLVDQFLQTKLH